MKFHIRFAEQVVGFFVLLALLAVAGLLILMGINQRWFSKDYHFTSRFESGNNLSNGMPIKLKGFKIGAVDAVTLLEDNTVMIDFHIFDTYYSKVSQNSVLELAVNPLGIGSSGLLFYPGKSQGPPLPENSMIPSLDMEEGKRLVAQSLVSIPKGSDAVSDILVSIGPTIDSLNTLLVSIDDLVHGKNTAPLGSLIRETDTIAANVREMSDGAVAPVGSILDNVETLTESLKDTTGIATRLLNPQGSVAKLLNDNEELYKMMSNILHSLASSAEEIRTLLAFANEKQPQISTLLDQTIDAINQGEDVLTGLKNNPLLRGGIPKTTAQPTTFGGLRDREF
ncbi:MlaD family protein [Sediminispirochaeta bajacaliforniensis]|uniref:MlaD family protein n=1 Tax=Sediminispirochaeta bajacaliforniensis TaxID=148 RepID=UPI00036EF338|nr:MlaD family protein [Sediminispirochaeta bajacaliforniensis]